MHRIPATNFTERSVVLALSALDRLFVEQVSITQSRRVLVEKALRWAGSLLVIPLTFDPSTKSVTPVIDAGIAEEVARLVSESTVVDRGVPIQHASVVINPAATLTEDSLWRHVVLAYAMGLTCRPADVAKSEHGCVAFKPAFASAYLERLGLLARFIGVALEAGGLTTEEFIDPL